MTSDNSKKKALQKDSGSTAYIVASSKTPTPPKTVKPSNSAANQAGRSVKPSPEELKIAELEQALAESKKNNTSLQRKVGRLDAALEAARQTNAEAKDKLEAYAGTMQDLQKNNTLLFKQVDYFEHMAARAIHDQEEMDKRHKELVQNLQKKIAEVATKHKAARGFIASLSPRYEADRIDWKFSQIKPIRPIGESPEKMASCNRTRIATIGIEAPKSWQECQTLLMIGQDLLKEYEEESDITIQAQIQAELQRIFTLVHDYKPTLSDTPKEPPQRRPAFVLGERPQLRATITETTTATSPCRDPAHVKKFLYHNDGKSGWVPEFLQATTTEQLTALQQKLREFLSIKETPQAITQHEVFLASWPLTLDTIPENFIKKTLHDYFIKIAELGGLEQITYSLDLVALNRAPAYKEEVIAVTAPKREPFSRHVLLQSFSSDDHNFLTELKKQSQHAGQFSQVDYGVLKKVFGDAREFSDLFSYNSYLQSYSIDNQHLKKALHNTDLALRQSAKEQNFDSVLIAFKALCKALIGYKEDCIKLVRAERILYDTQLEVDLQTAFDSWHQANATQKMPVAAVKPVSVASIFPAVVDATLTAVSAEEALMAFVYGPEHAFAHELRRQLSDPTVHRLDLSRLEAFVKARHNTTLFDKDPLNGLYSNAKLNHIHNQFTILKRNQDFNDFIKYFNAFYVTILRSLLPTMDRSILKPALDQAFQNWQAQYAAKAMEHHIFLAATPLAHGLDSVENDHLDHHSKTLANVDGLKQEPPQVAPQEIVPG